jgi:hypothetical protein
MAPTQAYNVMHNVMAKAKGTDPVTGPLMGGAVVVYGGDFRQLCPIPGEGQSVAECHFRNSSILAKCTKLELSVNMRADPVEAAFASDLKLIGEGRHPQIEGHSESSCPIPAEWMCSEQTVEALQREVFGDDPSESGANCAILTQTNEDCRKINNSVY